MTDFKKSQISIKIWPNGIKITPTRLFHAGHRKEVTCLLEYGKINSNLQQEQYLIYFISFPILFPIRTTQRLSPLPGLSKHLIHEKRKWDFYLNVVLCFTSRCYTCHLTEIDHTILKSHPFHSSSKEGRRAHFGSKNKFVSSKVTFSIDQIWKWHPPFRSKHIGFRWMPRKGILTILVQNPKVIACR